MNYLIVYFLVGLLCSAVTLCFAIMDDDGPDRVIDYLWLLWLIVCWPIWLVIIATNAFHGDDE